MNTPYQKHSRTSREAAEQLSNANTMENDIIAILRKSERDGATGDEIALNAWLRTEYPTLQSGTVSARLRGLELKGLACKTNQIRKTRNNRNAYVWKLPEYTATSELILNAGIAKKTVNECGHRKALESIREQCKTRHSSAAIYEIMKIIDKALTIQT